MRIVHVAPHCDDVGNGVVNVAVDLACGQADAGHEVAFAGKGGSLASLLDRHGVRRIEVNQGSRRPIEAGRTFFAFRRALAGFRPDIVHAHMVPGAVASWFARPGLGYRLVTTVHNEPQRQAILMGLGDAVIAVSTAVANSMRRRGVRAAKLRVVKNGTIGSPRRPSRSQGDVPHLDRPAITTVARLFSQKGIADLIAAFTSVAPAFPDATLYLLGEGPERHKFEAMAAASGYSERIHFLGFISNPRAYLDQSDIFVLASRRDPFPLVIPEAREAGCAIVATSVDGIPEALEDGRAGILVPPSEPGALAAALTRLLQSADELADWRRRASENIAWLRLDRVVDETLAVYDELLAPRRHKTGASLPS